MIDVGCAVSCVEYVDNQRVCCWTLLGLEYLLDSGGVESVCAESVNCFSWESDEFVGDDSGGAGLDGAKSVGEEGGEEERGG